MIHVAKGVPPAQPADNDCPVCRYGQLSTMVMMDVLACDFCRHIFSMEVSRLPVQLSILRLEDSAQPLSWKWTGQRWQAIPQGERSQVVWLWGLCLAIATIPASVMGLAVYLFPPADQSYGARVSLVWFSLTLASHLLVSLWLLAEHYQWPAYTRLKIFWNRAFETGG